MIVPSEIQSWYSDNRERLGVLERTVRGTLDHFVASRNYLFGGRIKHVESLAEKIDTGRVKSWDDLDDVYAGTVVIPTYAHELGVRSFLKVAFSEQYVVQRGSKQKSPELFRFDATRVYCRLSGEDLAPELAKITFEVQILSAFDYAWQKVTHDLVYKHEAVDWRRARVGAQMKALVEQLDAIGEHFDEFTSSITASEWPEVVAHNEVLLHINQLFSVGRLPTELRPVAANRLAQTVVSFLQSDGCRTHELKDRVPQAMAAIDTYLDSTAPRDIPRSLTLAQLIFGILRRQNVLSESVRHRILLNGPMLLAFPELKAYSKVFALDR